MVWKASCQLNALCQPYRRSGSKGFLSISHLCWHEKSGESQLWELQCQSYQGRRNFRYSEKWLVKWKEVNQGERWVAARAEKTKPVYALDQIPIKRSQKIFRNDLAVHVSKYSMYWGVVYSNIEAKKEGSEMRSPWMPNPVPLIVTIVTILICPLNLTFP